MILWYVVVPVLEKKGRKNGKAIEKKGMDKIYCHQSCTIGLFLLMYRISVVCKPMTRMVACVLYALLWGMNAGMLFYQDMRAKDPVAFSHSKVARVINSITMIGVVALCAIFFGVS